MLAERTGLEPATPGVTGRYANQLNNRSSILHFTAHLSVKRERPAFPANESEEKRWHFLVHLFACHREEGISLQHLLTLYQP